MTIARANCRAVSGATCWSIAASRKCTCQSSGRRRTIVSTITARNRLFAGIGRKWIGRKPIAENLIHRIARTSHRVFHLRIDLAELPEVENSSLNCFGGLGCNDLVELRLQTGAVDQDELSLHAAVGDRFRPSAARIRGGRK